jgi:hypothetical protein
VRVSGESDTAPRLGILQALQDFPTTGRRNSAALQDFPSLRIESCEMLHVLQHFAGSRNDHVNAGEQEEEP